MSLSFITILHRHIVRYAITLVRKKNWPPYNVCFHRLSKLREPLRYLVIIITETMSIKVSNYFSIEFISTSENSYIKENTKLTFLSLNHQISHCYILHLCQLIGIHQPQNLFFWFLTLQKVHLIFIALTLYPHVIWKARWYLAFLTSIIFIRISKRIMCVNKSCRIGLISS